ncbi:virulence factor family protein [Paraburkholderia sartisoli]|uniref:Type IV secretory pathway, VirJ component n=1 Tax=Paraburkholderia sartisoli TaxID=83784 RepID=A0A1H4A9Y0_9BURK|nr:AcvB/VirJ family lysyl-phosphatidylglycerol hydrolase [Paraburkholderia sartisoli]SEA32746.1 Type IV secretory pathway, VirJ component [Paraburkholderia sartisoli]
MKLLSITLALGLSSGLFAAVSSDAAAANAPAAPAARTVAAPVTTVSGGRFGNVTVTRPAGAMRGFVVLFSRAGGWRASDQQAADALAKDGAMVVGVDTSRYVASAAPQPETCHNLVGDVENISHQLQREAQLSHYFLPVVAGTGEGGTLATRMISTAPSNTLSGAASVDPDAKLDARFNPCPADPTISRGNGLPGFVEVAATTTAAVDAPAPIGGKPVPVRRLAANTSTADAMVALVTPHLHVHEAGEQDVSDLPLIELPAAHPTDMLAIVISGDGGWRDLDKTIAEALQKKNISVVGVDSLRYFWSTKSPEQTSHDLARIMETYGARWHTRHVALIGYSFGADVMPFAYNRLPEPLRAKVSQMALLGFAHDADFQIRVTGWLGMPASSEALPAMPEVVKVPPAIVQCIYGEDETDTLCPALVKTGASVIRTPGGHHFGHDYNHLADTILDSWRKQIAATKESAL